MSALDMFPETKAAPVPAEDNNRRYTPPAFMPATVGPKFDPRTPGYAFESSYARTLAATERAESSYLRERYEALQCALTQPCVVMRETPSELVSTANLRGASRQAAMAKAAGVKAKREMGRMFARELMEHYGKIANAELRGTFAVVVLTRIAPRPLDSDNLESALKAVRDGIAEGLGIDDRLSLVRYVTSQEQGGVRVHRVRCELFIQPMGALTRNEVSEEAT